MKLSFATLGCPEWDIETIARQAASLSFEGVELRGKAGEHLGHEESPETYARIKQLFDDAGVQVACIMGYSNFAGDDQAAVQDALAVMSKYIEVAPQLHCPTLRVFGGHNPGISQGEAIDRVAGHLKELAPQAERAGVKLAMETHDAWCVGENLAAVLDKVNSPAVGVCWDVANSFFVEPMDRTFAAIKGRIAHVHFKDGRRKDDGKVTSTLPGEGEVDMKGALQLLHDAGYDGWLSFEWEKKWQPELEEPEVAFPAYLKYTTTLMKELGVPRG